MSLFCGECKQSIDYGTPLFDATSLKSRANYALCGRCLDKVPASSLVPSLGGSFEGISIYRGSSDRDINGAYSWIGFKRGSFLFYIPGKIAKEYLPNASRSLLLA